MSFILDALRKSEHERERRALPGLIESPAAREAPARLAWVVGGFAVLLALNAAILLYVLLRPTPAVAPAAPTASAVAPPPATSTGGARLAAAPAEPGRIRPLAGEIEAAEPTLDVPEPPPVTHLAMPQPAVAPVRTPLNGAVWPTLRQLPAAVATALPPLNLDLHVYSSVASQRFVIINGQRVREGGQLHEGLLVEQITPEGALLNHQGTRFVLTRE